MATIMGTNKPNRIALYDGPTEDNDDIFGFGGDDLIWALGGNDWIRGGAGADIIDGDADFDYSDYGDSDERVYVDLLTHEALYGTAQGDILIRIEGLMGSIFDDGLVGDHERNDLRGNAGDDYLMGNGGDDALWGEAHNDTLEGGAGGDFLFGGAGIDRASYLSSTTGVTASLLRPGINRGDAAGDSYLSVETCAARISATSWRAISMTTRSKDCLAATPSSVVRATTFFSATGPAIGCSAKTAPMFSMAATTMTSCMAA